MSNIYVQEPPTSGKVLLKTTVGDIDIELWTKEAPMACRNFVQLCMEGYYNNTIFHRLVKKFIVQGGDPNGDGTGGESIYGHTFKDEFHSRLRFVRRGLVAMANSGKNDNGSQFFFTLGPTPELQNKHTIFGKIEGDTIYNALKLEEGTVDEDEKPSYTHKILKTIILNNPFDDIEPRVSTNSKSESTSKGKKKKEKGVKNFGLLSFGDEAEEEEQETIEFVQKNIAGKSKSTHDVLDDPKLSKEVSLVDDIKPKSSKSDEEDYEKEERSMRDIEEEASNVRNKLKRKAESTIVRSDEKKTKESEEGSDSDSDYDLDSNRKKEKFKKAEKIREEISKLKKDYRSDKKAREDLQTKEQEKEVKKEQSSAVMQEFISEQEKYTELKKSFPNKGANREKFTLELLNRFKNKLSSVKEKQADEKGNPDEDAAIAGDDWLGHQLRFEESDVILAKDAATKTDDWYDVFDPRNPLNKRKRGEKAEHSKK